MAEPFRLRTWSVANDELTIILTRPAEGEDSERLQEAVKAFVEALSVDPLYSRAEALHEWLCRIQLALKHVVLTNPSEMATSALGACNQAIAGVRPAGWPDA
jgi:hypothetical protein